MNLYTRRTIIQGNVLSLMTVCIAARRLAIASGLRVGSSAGQLGWDDFVDRVSVLARVCETAHWDQEQYVMGANALLARLRLNDPKLAAARKHYRDEHPGRPEFLSLERRLRVENEMISFVRGE